MPAMLPGSEAMGRVVNLTNISLPAVATSSHLWAAVLAGGDEIRLKDLTMKIVEDDRPKHFCRIVRAESLLSQTRARLGRLFSDDRRVFVVPCVRESRCSREFADAEDAIVVSQPRNRGTAVGIIAALVQMMQADPDAVVGFFPGDHSYSDDESLQSVVKSAAASAAQFLVSFVLLGAEAEYAEAECGWIEPRLAVSEAHARPLCSVNRFWEKPALLQALALLQKVASGIRSSPPAAGLVASIVWFVPGSRCDSFIDTHVGDDDLASPTLGGGTSSFARYPGHLARRPLCSSDRALSLLAKNIDTCMVSSSPLLYTACPQYVREVV
ncbi:MAG TPA: sugar phosphate nucleotidyltransferase [Bryobacteraceae bacterium]|jgi:hypothetical protein